MTKRKRRAFTKAFKAETVQLVRGEFGLSGELCA